MANGRLYLWCSAFVCALAFVKVGGYFVDITIVESAVAKGAVCLDGSPPAYHLAQGFGSGVNSWLVHFEGGGWCSNVTTCLERKHTRLGSSKEMAKQIAFSGILGDTPDYNPDFYNWNKVKVRYCDGSSFTGDVEEVDPTTKLHYRGARVWQAVMEDLLAKGMNKAENALISGCSAGGLTSILHCDRFHDLLPVDAKVKCLSDAGFFINEKDIAGVEYIAAFFNDVVTTHGSAKNLPSSCTSKLPPGMCFFPQNEVKQIQTPLFILNAAYDSWQVRNILVPGVSDPHGKWQSCKQDINQCSAAQLQILQGFRNDFLKALGGAWCSNVTTCLERKHTRLGSSKEMEKQIAFSGILSDTPDYNPDFYNWNKVEVRYCDGSSFTGDVEEVDPTTKLHYRGARVWQAVMEDLLAKGMNKAENALISGCSAGGLASILHCDRFHDLLPVDAKVKCLSDAGFFINEKDIAGVEYIAAFFNDVVTTHGSAKNLPPSCTSKLPPGMCFFPQNEVKQIQTPLFILNAAYDSWQVGNILVPGVADPDGKWQSCKQDINQCSAAQLQILQGFRNDFLKALAEQGNSTRGLFINSCFVHCQSETQETWFTSDSPMLGNKTIANAVGDWFYDGSPFQKIDCPYPCDSTCHN